eukprot:1564287-Amphidinium_carterae.1
MVLVVLWQCCLSQCHHMKMKRVSVFRFGSRPANRRVDGRVLAPHAGVGQSMRLIPAKHSTVSFAQQQNLVC